MSYATPADYDARFGERASKAISDRIKAGVADNTVLQRALTDASSLVDGYLGGRYTVPLSNAPDMIVAAVCDIARFNLSTTDPTEVVKLRYQAALGLLKDISASRVDLGPDVQGVQQVTEGNDIQFGNQGGNQFGHRRGWGSLP